MHPLRRNTEVLWCWHMLGGPTETAVNMWAIMIMEAIVGPCWTIHTDLALNVESSALLLLPLLPLLPGLVPPWFPSNYFIQHWGLQTHASHDPAAFDPHLQGQTRLCFTSSEAFTGRRGWQHRWLKPKGPQQLSPMKLIGKASFWIDETWWNTVQVRIRNTASVG